MLDIILREPDARVQPNPSHQILQGYMREGKGLLWLDLVAPSKEELSLVLHDLFPVHTLAYEDAWLPEGTPKIDNYGDYLVVVFHSIHSPSSPLQLEIVEHTAIIGHRVLITVTVEREGSFAHAKDPGWHRYEGLAHGPAQLFYHLLDQQVDQSRAHLEDFEGVLASLGDVIFTRNLSTASEHQIMEDILSAKSTALRLFRIVEPQAQVLYRLGHEHFGCIPPEARIFFQDTHDQAKHLIALTASLRDLATSTMTTHLTLANHRLNEVMKVLTMMATVFIPLTFLTSIYGMNFRYMPELARPWAYPAVWGICGVVVIGMLVFFKRKRWL